MRFFFLAYFIMQFQQEKQPWMYEMTCVHTFEQMWMQWPRWSQPVALFPSTLHFILWKPRAPDTSDKSGHESCGPKEERFAWYELRMNLSANMDSHPWLTENPNFTNNEFRGHLLTGAPYVFWTLGRTSDWVLSFPHCALLVCHTLSESTTAGKPWFYFSTKAATCRVQSELHKLYPLLNLYWPIRMAQFGNLICITLEIFTIKSTHPFVSVEHKLGCYLNLLSPGLQLLLLK